MTEEAKELYFHTKNRFMKDLKRISPTCVAPLIETRKVVKKAIELYIKDYCTKDNNPFTENDFQKVSNKIYNEIMKNEL